MPEPSYQLCESETGHVIVPRLQVARSLYRQTVGLIGRKSLEPDAGLWLEPCNSIHTFGMRFAIDVLFLDRSGTLIHVAEKVRPFRVCWPVWKARVVVELPAGTIALRGIGIGKRYILR